VLNETYPEQNRMLKNRLEQHKITKNTLLYRLFRLSGSSGGLI